MPPNFSSTANEIWAVAELLRGGFKQSQYGRVILPISTLAEQRAIVAHLDEKCGKLDLLKAKAERAIELLKECRSALISAAVTGKIDVRDHSN